MSAPSTIAPVQITANIPIRAALLSGPREGEIVELPADIVATAPAANGDQAELESMLFQRLNHLALTLERLHTQIKLRADAYEAAIACVEAKV